MCATTPLGFGRSSRASAAVNLAPRSTCVAAPNSWILVFSSWIVAVSQSTTSSSTRAASARAMGTVAASTGSSGSSFCVQKIRRFIEICAAFRSEEVEITEGEMPGVTPLREGRRIGGQALADEADRSWRRKEAGGEEAQLLAGIDHGDGDVGVHQPERAIEAVAVLAHDGRREPVPDGVRHDDVARLGVRARRIAVAPAEVRLVPDDVMRRQALRPRGDVSGADAARALPAQPLRPHPDPERRHVLPAELAD